MENKKIYWYVIFFFFRNVEQENTYFLLQQRKGTEGATVSFGGLIVGTLDSVFDTKPPPFRILHQTPNSELYYCKCAYFFI